jgi:FolB domain-containing protein
MKMLMQLKDFSYLVRLGCSEAERSFPQEVRLSIDIEYPVAPDICYTDKIGDGICYAQLGEKCAQVIEAQAFQTIEHLAYKVLQTTLENCSKGLSVVVRAHKVKPPIMRFTQGVVIELSGQS